MTTKQPQDMSDLPDDVQWRLQRADGFIDLKMFSQARGELAAIPEAHRASITGKLIRLRLAREEEDWAGASILATEMTSVMPKNPGFWVELAYAKRRAEGVEAARAVLTEAAALFPDGAIIPYNLACYECQLGNHDTALRLLTKALAIDPSYRDAALEDKDLEPLWELIQ